MDKKWKLGDDLDGESNILDGFTFKQVISDLHAGERNVDRDAVKRVVKRFLDGQVEDMWFLVENNMDEIIAAAKCGRDA